MGRWVGRVIVPAMTNPTPLPPSRRYGMCSNFPFCLKLAVAKSAYVWGDFQTITSYSFPLFITLTHSHCITAQIGQNFLWCVIILFSNGKYEYARLPLACAWQTLETNKRFECVWSLNTCPMSKHRCSGRVNWLTTNIFHILVTFLCFFLILYLCTLVRE